MHVSAAENHQPRRRDVFLHSIEAGPASRSYGVQVGGWPHAATLVLQAPRARSAEAQQKSGDAQIDPFAAPTPTPETEASLVDKALSAINPDMLSPKEALDALYRLKSLQDTSS